MSKTYAILKYVMEKMEKEVRDVLEKIRPYIQRDGGDVEFVRIEDGVVTVRMLGACASCLSLDETLKIGIEATLMEEVDGVKEVVMEAPMEEPYYL